MRRLIAQLFASLIAWSALADPIGTPGGTGTGLAPGAINDIAFFALNLCPNVGEQMVKGTTGWTCVAAFTNADFETPGTSPVATGPGTFMMQDIATQPELNEKSAATSTDRAIAIYAGTNGDLQSTAQPATIGPNGFLNAPGGIGTSAFILDGTPVSIESSSSVLFQLDDDDDEANASFSFMNSDFQLLWRVDENGIVTPSGADNLGADATRGDINVSGGDAFLNPDVVGSNEADSSIALVADLIDYHDETTDPISGTTPCVRNGERWGNSVSGEEFRCSNAAADTWVQNDSSVSEATLEARWGTEIFTGDDLYYTPPYNHENLDAGDDNWIFWVPRDAVTLTAAWCVYDAASALTTAPTLRISDGAGNFVTMTDITCANGRTGTPTPQSITANGSINALESVAFHTIIGPSPNFAKVTLHLEYALQ